MIRSKKKKLSELPSSQHILSFLLVTRRNHRNRVLLCTRDWALSVSGLLPAVLDIANKENLSSRLSDPQTAQLTGAQ